MIHYLILLLAVLMFTAQFGFTKIYGEKAEQKTTPTYVMLVIISIIGAVMYLLVGGFKVHFSWNLILYASLFAIIMIPYYILGIKVLSLGSVAIYSMFMMLGGMLLPFVYGLVLLDEPLTFGKTVGCIILTAAIFMQSVVQKNKNENLDENSEKKGLFILLCIAIFILNGMTGVIAKAYQVSESTPDEIGFTVISCIFTAIFSILFLIPNAVKNKEEVNTTIKKALSPVLLLCMTAIGIFTHTGNFLHLKVAAHLPASIQFPMVSGGVIVFSAIVSTKLFKEKMCKAELWCIIAACFSTLMFAF